MKDGMTPNPTTNPPQREPAKQIKAAAQDALRTQKQLVEQREDLDIRETVEKAIESGRFAILIYYRVDDDKDPTPLKHERRVREFPRDGYRFISDTVGELVAQETNPTVIDAKEVEADVSAN